MTENFEKQQELLARLMTRWARYQRIDEKFLRGIGDLESMVRRYGSGFPPLFLSEFDKWVDEHIQDLQELLEIKQLLGQDMEEVLTDTLNDIEKFLKSQR